MTADGPIWFCGAGNSARGRLSAGTRYRELLLLAAALHARGHRLRRRGSTLFPPLRSRRLPYIVKLQAAVAAMVKVRAPRILQIIEQALMHLIDLVARHHARQAISAAPRATRVVAQIKRIPARLGLSCVTLPALVHRHVQHLLGERSMHSPQPSPASWTVEHVVLFYTPIARTTQHAPQ
jgi:hypothetical protein